MISLEQINNQFVEAIPIPDEDIRPVKGYDICEEAYANIFLCAKKKSGKTSALFKIMKECAGKNTIIIVFCSTVYKDKNWIQIRKYFEKKKMEIHVFTSMFEDGTDQLADLVEDLRHQAKEEEEKKKEKKRGEGKKKELSTSERCDMLLERLTSMHLRAIGRGAEIEESEDEDAPKQKRSKYLEPEYMIIFDDINSELKSKSLVSLLKWNRHYKSKVIISSQWLHDLLPDSRKQLDLFLIFKGFPEEKLALIYKDCDSSIPFDLFTKIYYKSTKMPHSFMYIDTRADSFRRNFDSKFIIHTEEDENI